MSLAPTTLMPPRSAGCWVIALSMAAQTWSPSNEAPRPVTRTEQVSARVGELLLPRDRRPSPCPRCTRDSTTSAALVATLNIGGSVVLTEGACPALGVQPSRDVVSLMLGEPAALASTQNESGLAQGLAGRPAAGCACGSPSAAGPRLLVVTPGGRQSCM